MISNTSHNLDDFLLDVATAIELSEHDRRVAENRYRRLKEHLEHPENPLAAYLVDNESRIYPQGSMATGTAVVTGNGKDEDRFDLDALVELKVPPEWSPKKVLDLLYEALEDFPDAISVVRCTRCVQLQFAFMHMDVTVMSPENGNRIARAGEIFHSPDKGLSERVPANPYGFSYWFRANVHVRNEEFMQALQKRRAEGGIDRLSKVVEFRAAQQDDLPPILPPRLDSEQVVAFKLLKRNVYVAYGNRNVRQPPSIYLAKMAVDVGTFAAGLTEQLLALAQYVRREMEQNLAVNQMPDERNPTYNLDRLNDRWPTNREDMRILADDMSKLISSIERARHSDFTEINKIFAELFGERVTKQSAETFLRRASHSDNQQTRYQKGTGTVVLADAIVAPAVARLISTEPRHNFHCEILKKDK